MKRKGWIIWSLVLLVFTIVVGVIWATGYYADLPARISQHETIVLGQNRLVPGSQAAMRVVTRDSKDGSPLENASIRVSMRPGEPGQPAEAGDGETLVLYEGVTDETGASDVNFWVPSDGEAEQTLVIETTSPLGSDLIERTVNLERTVKILLTSDKPVYQPGQVIHIRALALSSFDLKPAANQDLEVVIADGKGNKVFRESMKTSDWGVAAVDFHLASEVNTGSYNISAVLGSTRSEKTVTVEHYVLPKFEVSIETEKSFYLPGERVRGSLAAQYFYGKPVAGGEISLEGYTFDVERVVNATLQGNTDENGRYDFEFDLPDYLAGSDLEEGGGRFYLQAVVTDLAKHSEISNLSIPVSSSSLVIEAIPEGGQFKPGVENLLYVLTSYPDGRPAKTTLNILFYNSNESVQVESGAYGLATVAFIPGDPWQGFNIEARDEMGNRTAREFYFEGQWAEESVLLRPEKPVYRVGETMGLTILTSAKSGSVYLDIVREGQTVRTEAVEMQGGQASMAVDLTPDLYGTLELHAYKILRSGNITRDTRLVVVDQAEALSLTLGSEEIEYKPGAQAQVNIQIHGESGSGVQAAVGLAVVDEAVFALAEQDPGFAKLYFMLEKELLEPKYDLHGYRVGDLAAGVRLEDPEMESAVEESAQASLAAAIPLNVSYSLEANSHQDAMQKAYQRQTDYFSGLGKGLFGVYLLVAMVSLVLAVTAVAREKVLGRSLLTSLGVAGIPALVLVAWPHPWARTPMEKVSVLMDWLSWRGEGLLLALAAWLLVGLIGLMVVAARRKDGRLGWMLGLIPITVVVFVGMVMALMQAGTEPNTLGMIFGVIAFLMIPTAFLMRFSGFLWAKRVWTAIATLPVVLFLGFGILPVVMAGSVGMVKSNAGDMLMAEPMAGLGVVEEAMPVMEMAAPAAADGDVMLEKEESGKDTTTGPESEAPRLRQYFPETMVWLPDLVTDENGTLSIEFPVADSITTWRMTALASSQDGRLGSTTAPLRVFQDFFVDVDLPLALTVGDEVSVPVGVFNYLEEAQTVRLVLEPADWFEMESEGEVEMEIGGNDISVVYFRIRATRFGLEPFQVTAWGSEMSDAIRKEVRVFPDGKEIHFSRSDRLEAGKAVAETVAIPEEAIAGTQRLTVKIYPGILSQVVEGLESILRMPYGCFEQTSSTTYPNVLVLDYLKFTEQAAPEVQFKAEEYINLGYQRLATFEVGGSGGFSLFGDPPPDRMLTAYGLQEFSDMGRVYNVDPALVERAAAWLFSQQDSNGSWANDRGLVHENAWANLGDDRLPVTAYIVWSLADAGFSGDGRTQAGLAYVREHASKATDAYSLALIANAMVAMDVQSGSEIGTESLAILERLAGMAIQEGSGALWQSGVATFMGSEGQTGSIETTALAALAFLRANRYAELANAALTTLIQQKDSFGTWYSTQATVLALKALIQSVRMGAENVDAQVRIQLNGGQTRTVSVNQGNFDVVQLVTFDDINIGRENQVSIEVTGEGGLMYQVAGGYFLPWDKVAAYPQLVAGGELVDIEVAYDRTEMAVNDTVGVAVTVSLLEGQAESALIDLGLPPGFSVETETLAALVARFEDVPEDYAFARIERFELTGRQILIYISNLEAGKPMEFSYQLRAKFPLEAQTPASNVYDYYNPEVNGEAVPVLLVVGE